MLDANFWQDKVKSQKIVKEKKLFEGLINSHDHSNKRLKDLEDLIRNKFTIQYKSNKDIDPFVSYEIFNPSNSGVGEMNEYRLSVGVDIGLPKKKSAKIYYQYKIEDLDKKNPEVLNVLGLSLRLN